MLTQMTLEMREMSWFKWQYIHYHSPKKQRELYEKKYFRLIYFERYLEFSNLTEPRQRVSSELCMAEKGRLLGVQEKALSAGPPAAFPWLAEMQRHNFPRLFLGAQNTVGV